MDDRLRLAYMTAMRAQHDGGRIEIHLGSAVIAHLKALAYPPAPPIERLLGSLGPAPRFGGFPVVESTISPNHISIHVVTVIP